ncbi:tripartite tricarboxylate transporter substrate binding protein [Aquabacter sp. CN5-332]|uniref:Bug family tripartite tricarboxylate transporter substrate binding protein n=1 Tax=Aquabacter sp. CN5-332 TaxID=3156608 RepID=UPI0032B35164
MSRRALAGLAMACAALWAAPSAALDYPTRSIRLVVPYPPGGSADLIGRLIGEKLSASLGQPVVVDNRGGASGAIGSEFVARSAPDGYTLLVAISDTHAINPAVSPRLPYDPQKDFAPISLVAVQPFLLVVGPSLKVKDLADFIRQAKDAPGKLTYASNGIGGLQHLAMVQFSAQTGTDLAHVPYKGAAPALSDVMGGHVDALFISIQGVGTNLKQDKLRALAIASSHRLAPVADVPTFKEAGVTGVEVNQWYSIFAPAGTPNEIVQLLSARVQEAVKSPEVSEKLRAAGTEPIGSTPAELRDFLAGEIAQWARVAKSHDIKVE